MYVDFMKKRAVKLLTAELRMWIIELGCVHKLVLLES